MLVDALASPEAIASLTQRQADIRATAEHYGLTTRTAVVIGGAALALQGLDSYVQLDPDYDSPFDVDVVRIPSRYRAIFGTLQASTEDTEAVAYDATEQTLPFSVIAGSLMAKHFAVTLLGYKNYKEFLRDRVFIGDLAMLPTVRVAMIKSRSSRPKDRAGLIKAHAFAAGTEHPITADPVWRASVANSMLFLRRDHREFPGIFGHLAWLDELVEHDFDHAAFSDLHI